MTLTQINLSTADARLSHRPRPETTDQRRARLERYLAERAAFSWTSAYRAAQAELAALKGAS